MNLRKQTSMILASLFVFVTLFGSFNGMSKKVEAADTYELVYSEDMESTAVDAAPTGWGENHKVKASVGVSGSKAMLVTGAWSSSSVAVNLVPGYTYKLSADVGLNATEVDDNGWNGLMLQAVRPFWKVEDDNHNPLDPVQLSRIAIKEGTVETGVKTLNYTAMPADKSFTSISTQFVAPAYPDECPVAEQNVRIDILNLTGSAVKSAYVDNIKVEKVTSIAQVSVTPEPKPTVIPVATVVPTIAPTTGPTTEPTAASNIMNGDTTFESYAEGEANATVFDFHINATKSIVAGGANGTAKAFKFNTAGWGQVFQHGATPFAANTNYKLSLYYKGSLFKITLTLPDDDGDAEDTAVIAVENPAAASDWKLFEYEFTTGSNTMLSKVGYEGKSFVISLQGSTGDVYLDELSLAPVVVVATPEPTVAPTVDPTVTPTVTPTVAPTQVPKLAMPSVSVNSATTKVTGSYSVNGAKVTLYSGTKSIGSATVSSGKFSISISKQAPGAKLTAKATKAGYTTSSIRSITVSLQKATVSANSKSVYVTGKAFAKSTVSVYYGSKKLGSAKATSTGSYKVKISSKIRKGKTITVKSTYGKYSSVASYKLSK